jgi:hypothetical protein
MEDDAVHIGSPRSVVLIGRLDIVVQTVNRRKSLIDRIAPQGTEKSERSQKQRRQKTYRQPSTSIRLL